MTRESVIETRHADARAARTVARAIEPDNTDDVVTESAGATVRTTITRPTTGGLQSSVDDYVVNVRVANSVIGHVRGDAGDADPVRADDSEPVRTDSEPVRADDSDSERPDSEPVRADDTTRDVQRDDERPDEPRDETQL